MISNFLSRILKGGAGNVPADAMMRVLEALYADATPILSGLQTTKVYTLDNNGAEIVDVAALAGLGPSSRSVEDKVFVRVWAINDTTTTPTASYDLAMNFYADERASRTFSLTQDYGGLVPLPAGMREDYVANGFERYLHLSAMTADGAYAIVAASSQPMGVIR